VFPVEIKAIKEEYVFYGMTMVLSGKLDSRKIHDLRGELKSTKSIFKNKTAIDTSTEVLGRYNEASLLLSNLDYSVDGYLPSFIQVFGRSGSGKSSVVNLVCKELSDIFEYKFVNLRQTSTIFGCAQLILKEIGGGDVSKYSGINAALIRIEDTIRSILGKNKFFVLVLDEFDAIFSDKRGNASDFVYKLLNVCETLKKENLHLCIVAISNRQIKEEKIESRVISRIRSYDIFFEDYGKEDLYNILHHVSSKAFRKKVPDDVLRYCAEISSEDNGDARQALDLLRTAGDLCMGKITKNDVDMALAKIQEDTFVYAIKKSGINHKLAFISLARLSYLTDVKWHSTSSLYKQYVFLSEEKPRKITYRRFYDILRDLEQLGICTAKTASHGRYGYNTEFMLTVPAETVRFLKESLWNEWVDWKGHKFLTKNGFYAANGASPDAKLCDVKNWQGYLGNEFFTKSTSDL
jgi:cell division control protein 6